MWNMFGIKTLFKKLKKKYRKAKLTRRIKSIRKNRKRIRSYYDKRI